MSPAIGLALAELALDGTTRLAIDHLDPARPLGAGTVRRTVASDLASLAPLH
jgi:glycine/D-amino acid oxidase-like deaminating enzyme